MYKIESVKIENFWQRFGAETKFNPDVNIIIGKNGTGKTTFMNILHSVLSVDVEQLNNADFESIEIKLKEGKKRKTIKARIIENDLNPFLTIEYQISSKKYKVRMLSSDDRRFAPHYRRRTIEESEEVRGVLARIVSLSALSVYRLRSGEDYEVRDNRGTTTITPVDFRLNQLLQNLTTYQLELSQEARDIATDLQKEVLASILYSQDDMNQKGYELDYDKKQEKTNLVSAYQQLNAIDSKIRRKISFHVDSIDNTISSIKEKNSNVDFRSLEALRNTRKIIKMSLDAEKKTSKVYEPITLFLNILSEFIIDKKFEFNSGSLLVHNGYDDINYNSLSSGEKQLLILFIETLLQRNKPYVFLTDEPELSLHISWQRKIIPAIRRLNPCAQVIAATHSPEVASKYRNSIFDMEKLVHG